MLREDAYTAGAGHAMRAWKEDLVFRDEVAKDGAITALLSPEKLRRRSITRGSWGMWTRSLRGCWGSEVGCGWGAVRQEGEMKFFAGAVLAIGSALALSQQPGITPADALGKLAFMQGNGRQAKF